MTLKPVVRTTQAEKVTTVYEDGVVAGFIHYDAKARNAIIYKCEPMTEEEIAERIATPKPHEQQ